MLRADAISRSRSEEHALSTSDVTLIRSLSLSKTASAGTNESCIISRLSRSTCFMRNVSAKCITHILIIVHSYTDDLRSRHRHASRCSYT